MIKKIAIWLFKLHDLRNLYISERLKQREMDREELAEEMHYIQEEHKKELGRLQQSLEAEIEVKNRELIDFKNRERYLIEREFLVKKQNNINLTKASQIYNHVFHVASLLQKEAAEINGLVDLGKDNIIKQIKERQQ